MRHEIKVAADHSGRSMNAEIVARLGATFDKEFDAPVEIVQIKPISISKQNAAALLGVSQPELDLLVEQGFIPRPKVAGTIILYPAKEFESAARRFLAD